MADTRMVAANEATKFARDFTTEYFQQNLFSKEMGSSENAIIQVNRQLAKDRGKNIQFMLQNLMTGSGVTGTETLRGNEEAIQYRSFQMTPIKRRHAFVVHEQDRQYSTIDLLPAGRSALMSWAQRNTRDRIIAAFNSINGVLYGDASETQKDAWLVDNADRVLFGAAKSNNSGNDHSASLANVDGTSDKLTSGAISLMKRMAILGSPAIRPVESSTSGRRFYCAYAHPLAFRDLKTDATITQAQREVGLKMQNEKLFRGGDIEWDGVIIKELDDMPLLSGVGAGGIDVAPVYFCGAQAVGYGISRQWWTSGLKEDDYGDLQGYAINEFGNFAKLRFGTGASDTDDTKDHGLVTGYFSAVADS